MHRLLKPTGSIYLHCDWHADAYIRVHILDKIFGRDCFVNELIWGYQWGGVGKRNFAKKHDNIYWYCKQNKKWIFNEKEMREAYITKDKRWHNNEGGKLLRDVWDDIPIINTMANERIGYPTQKPLALLERIIKASSNEGDVVMDPFMGGGTTIVMASRLGRQFIGIDQSIAAVDVTDKRLQSDGLYSQKDKHYEIEKYYYSEEDLKAVPHFEFEKWIISKFGGIPNTKQTGDYGIDGLKDGVPIQVKK